MRVSIFTGPYAVGEQMGGIGLRMWELALALTAAGLSVEVIAGPGSDPGWSRPGLLVEAFDEDTWQRRIEAAEVVVTTDLPDARVLLHAHACGRLLISENAAPIEHLYYHRLAEAPEAEALYDRLRAQFLLQAWTSDHFLARSEMERTGLFAVLAGIGRLSPTHHAHDPALGHLVSHIPIGFSREADHAARAAAATVEPTAFAWAGGVWDYLDTGALCQALARVPNSVRVRFCYPPPATQRIAEADRLRDHIHALGLAPQVLLPDAPLDHSRRDGVLAACWALVCLGRPGAENQTCHRLRLRDVWLYRRPIVIDAHGASGQWVQRLGVGLAVDTANTDEVAQALGDLSGDTPVYRRCRSAINTYRAAHRLDRAITPLLRFLRARRRAPDADTSRQRRAVRHLTHTHPALGIPLDLL